MKQVSHVKKLGPKGWHRDMDNLPFHLLAVGYWLR